jgi:hypothetical protein
MVEPGALVDNGPAAGRAAFAAKSENDLYRGSSLYTQDISPVTVNQCPHVVV